MIPSQLAATALLALLSATLVTASPPPPRIEKLRETVVDEQALYLPDGRWGKTTNGRSFQQEAVASFSGFQYATHFDADRRLCVARRALASSRWDVIRFDDYRFKGNDTHNAPVLGICPADGTIHLAFDHHGHPLHYRVSSAGVATRPREVEWSAALFGPVTDELEPGRKIARVTYPRFITTPQGGLQFQCRIGGSGNGSAYLADYVAGHWDGFAPFISGAGEWNGNNSRNAYENGYSYDDAGRLHVTWCWRETGGPMTNHDLCYARSDDNGKTWRNESDKVVGRRDAAAQSQINIDSPGIKVYDIPQGRGLINSTTQAIDSRGRVHVVTWHLPDEVPRQANWAATRPLTRFFHYWRDDKGQWQRMGMPFGGNRGQACFDHADNAYLVFVADDRLCIAAAAAEGGWADWQIIHRETQRFTDQPLLDSRRIREQGILSVYAQQAPAQSGDAFSPLNVIDYRLGQR